MKSDLFGVVVAGVAVLTLNSSSASVFEDAAFWIRGFRDTNGDEIVAGSTDVPDARQVNMSANCTAYGVSKSRIWREEEVFCPYNGETFVAPCCYLSQTTEDSLSFCGSFGLIAHERISVTNGVGSVVARVRPEPGLVEDNWLTGGIGFQLGFKKASDGRLILRGNVSRDGGSAVNRETAFVLEPNAWLDVAMVRDEESVRFYAATNGFTFTVAYDAAALTKVTNNFYFGHFQETKSSGTSKAAYINCFRGSIHQMAVWNRCLSEAEVREAFAFPRSDVFRVGFVNGSAEEFGREEPSSSPVSPSNWYAVPAKLEKGAMVQLAFSVPTGLGGFCQDLRLTTTSDSQAGTLQVAIDGRVCTTLETTPSKTSSLLVPAEMMSSGAHVLSLTRLTDGTTHLDALSLGGSVQIGIADNSNAEFGRIQDGVPIRSYMEDCNLKNTAQVIEQSKTNEWKVVLSKDIALSSRWQFDVSAYTGKSISTYTEPLRVAMLVNGTVVEVDAFNERYQTFSVKLPCGILHPGENTLGFANLMLPTQSGYYVNLDCVRLLTRGEPSGLILIFR